MQQLINLAITTRTCSSTTVEKITKKVIFDTFSGTYLRIFKLLARPRPI